jgi:hypothetical protein
MVELMMNTEAQQTQAPTFERGSRYVIRIGKREGLTRLSTEYYPRYILRNLRWTPLEDTSIVQVNTPRALLLFTSHLHPHDADDIRRAFNIFPEVEMYPIVEDVEQGNPYRGTFCVSTFPKRKSTRLPRVAKYLSHYRWVVYEKVGGEKHGILISKEPNIPDTADLASDAYLITASDEEDSVYFDDLTGYRACFNIPLSHSCL